MNPTAQRDLLIYVQVPFCPSKCHFCGWVADIPVRDLRLREGDSPRAAYLEAVRTQIRDSAPRLKAAGYRPAIMYWGGGTGSILSPAEFNSIMDTLHAEFDLSGLAEATLEGSPDTMTPEKLRTYRAAGFTRVSMGVQSFDDERLAKEGRSHRSGQARDAVHMIRDAGFEHVNVDLMCGLPGETIQEFHGSAKALVSLPVTHISLYPYAPVQGTVMYRQIQRKQVELDRKERMLSYALGRKMFEQAGFPEYAMSYFGTQPCRADLAYYRLEMDYVGFGSGADSLLDGESLTTHKDLARYTAAPTGFASRQPASDKAARFLLYQSLAMFEGIDADRWQERIGVPLWEVLERDAIAGWIGLLENKLGLIRDEHGVRLPRERIAGTYLDFLWAQVPTAD